VRADQEVRPYRFRAVPPAATRLRLGTYGFVNAPHALQYVLAAPCRFESGCRHAGSSGITTLR